MPTGCYPRFSPEAKTLPWSLLFSLQTSLAERRHANPKSVHDAVFCFDFAQDGGEKMKGDPMDLRLDIERRKKYSSHDRDYNQNQGRAEGDSPDSSRERSVEKFSKRHKRSKYVQQTFVLFQTIQLLLNNVVY